MMINIFSCVYLPPMQLFGEVSVQVFCPFSFFYFLCLFSKWFIFLMLSLESSFLLQIQVLCQMICKYVLPFYGMYLSS